MNSGSVNLLFFLLFKTASILTKRDYDEIIY